LAFVPTIARALPVALERGARYASTELVWWGEVGAILFAAVVLLTARADRRKLAALALVVATLLGAVWIERQTFPTLDRTVSARGVWRQIAARRSQVCVADADRAWLYGLNYYSVTPLPDCRIAPRPIRIP
jgi:hypothetical protein